MQEQQGVSQSMEERIARLEKQVAKNIARIDAMLSLICNVQEFKATLELCQPQISCPSVGAIDQREHTPAGLPLLWAG